ncbi:hypothetical protein Tco_1570144 [Tanacetum coccineum]
MIHFSQEVLDLEKEKDVQVVEIIRLKKRVKRLERQGSQAPHNQEGGNTDSTSKDCSSILLLAILDEYHLRFHGIKDAKSLWAAIKSRFGGNVESKKMQKTCLKLDIKGSSEYLQTLRMWPFSLAEDTLASNNEGNTGIGVSTVFGHNSLGTSLFIIQYNVDLMSHSLLIRLARLVLEHDKHKRIVPVDSFCMHWLIQDNALIVQMEWEWTGVIYSR